MGFLRERERERERENVCLGYNVLCVLGGIYVCLRGIERKCVYCVCLGEWGNVCVFERDREKMCLLCVLGRMGECMCVWIERKCVYCVCLGEYMCV